MTARCYQPTPGEIRRYLQESLHATNRLSDLLVHNPVARSYLQCIRNEISAALCNLELGAAALCREEIPQ